MPAVLDPRFCSPATRPPPRWPRHRRGPTGRGTCARHLPMPMRAACARRGVPVPVPRRGPGAVRRYSPVTSSRRTNLRVHCRPSPCDRLSRPPSTAAAPPRSGGNSGRRTCPGTDESDPAGAAGALPTFTNHRLAGSVPSFTPVASPAVTATRRLASLARSLIERARRPPSAMEDRAPQPPIATGFGAGDESRGVKHWFGFPAPVCLACGPGPPAVDRSYVVGAAPVRFLTSGDGLAPASPGRCGGRGWATLPTR